MRTSMCSVKNELDMDQRFPKIFQEFYHCKFPKIFQNFYHSKFIKDKFAKTCQHPVVQCDTEDFFIPLYGLVHVEQIYI